MKLLRPSDDLVIAHVDLSRLQLRPTAYQRARLEGMPEGESPLGWMYRQLLCAGKSDYLENKLLDHTLRKSAYTQPSVLAMALCTVAPGDSATGATLTEASYTGYAEKVIEPASLNSASGGETTSSAAIEFAACTGGSSTIIGVAIKDSSTIGAGNVLYIASVSSTVVSTTATPVTINTGQLKFTED